MCLNLNTYQLKIGCYRWIYMNLMKPQTKHLQKTQEKEKPYQNTKENQQIKRSRKKQKTKKQLAKWQ